MEYVCRVGSQFLNLCFCQSIGALILQMYNTQIQKWNISLGGLIVGQSGTSFQFYFVFNIIYESSVSRVSYSILTSNI